MNVLIKFFLTIILGVVALIAIAYAAGLFWTAWEIAKVIK